MTKPKPETVTRQEFQCPCCQAWFVVGVAKLPRPQEVIESQREKLKQVCKTPIPRIDIENGNEIVSGNEDQRFVTRCEQTSIDELFRKDKQFRPSARRAFR
jgi:hypothetical protein